MTPEEKLAAMEELVGKENIRIKHVRYDEEDEGFWTVICGSRAFVYKDPESPHFAVGYFSGQGATKEEAIEDDWAQNVSQTEDTGCLRVERNDGSEKYAKWLGNHWLITDEPFLGLRSV